jgi:flagellar basal-body rod protein FlgB
MQPKPALSFAAVHPQVFAHLSATRRLSLWRHLINLLENTMLEQMTARLDAYGQSLVLRSQRQQVIASNIANADTPGYVARDFDFAAALKDAAGGSNRQGLAQTAAGHMRLSGPQPGDPKMAYAVQTQPSQDGNSVDLDRERANFVDNTIRYESTLRFINSNVKTMLSAITGQ